MKKLIAIVFALLVVGGASAACQPTVSVEALPFEVREDFTQSFSGVGELTQSSNHATTRAGKGVGATKVAISVTGALGSDTEGCPVLRIRTGYADAVLYVVRELNSNVCAHEEVLRHERHHVKLYQEALATLPQRVRSSLEPKLAAALADGALSATRVNQLLAVAMDEAAAVMAAQNDFDSEAEYDRSDAACDGAIPAAYRRWVKRRA